MFEQLIRAAREIVGATWDFELLATHTRSLFPELTRYIVDDATITPIGFQMTAVSLNVLEEVQPMSMVGTGVCTVIWLTKSNDSSATL